MSAVTSTSTSTQDTMAVWADNIKFVRDIIDTKFGKIDQAVQEVGGWAGEQCHASVNFILSIKFGGGFIIFITIATNI